MKKFRLSGSCVGNPTAPASLKHLSSMYLTSSAERPSQVTVPSRAGEQPMNRLRITYESLKNHLRFAATFLLLLTIGVGSAWGLPTVLFHETFGDNSGSARDWKDTYSVKSGVSAVYSGITGYTVSNVKQGKNTTGSTKSGLNQSSQGTDAYIIIGPLAVSSYTSLGVTYQWKAASVKDTYSTSLYYATSSGGSYTEVSGTGTGATTFVERSYSLPAAAQVSTLYLKIVFNTSNAQAIIDEVELTGTETVSCLNKVTVSKGSESNGTFTLDKTGEQNACDALSVTVTPSPADHYHVASVTATTPTTGGAPTVTGPSAGKYTVAYAANSTGSSTINVAFEEDPTYTVTWVAGGNSSFHTQTNYAGTALTAPSTPDASTYCPGGKVFVGWTATEIVGTPNTQPTDLFTSVSGMSIPATNKTYYAVFATESVAESKVTDNLTRATTEVTSGSTSYSGWSDKTATSNAIYAGNSAGGNNSIQLRSKYSNSGIVTTASGGKVQKITITWNSNTISGRTVDVYGKNDVYVDATNLYNDAASTQGTKLGSIAYGTTTTLSITDDYTYIGLRSHSDALYLDNVAIEWLASTTTHTAYATSCCTPLGGINGSVDSTQ